MIHALLVAVMWIGGFTPEKLTVSVPEAARLLGISRNSAYEAVKSGQLPVVRIGRRLLVPLSQLTAFLGETRDSP